MDAKTFDELVESENKRSVKMLCSKAKEYATEGDRLSNFKQAAGLRGTNPVDALVGMLVKHWTSISDMAKNPTAFSLEKWDEKLVDDRNYTYLIRGLLLDMHIRSGEQLCGTSGTEEITGLSNTIGY